MASKQLRNLIIALIILVAGIWFIGRISDSLLGKFNAGGFDALILQFKQLSTTITIGLGVIIILLIIIYIAKRIGGGKQKELPSGIRDIRTPRRPKYLCQEKIIMN